MSLSRILIVTAALSIFAATPPALAQQRGGSFRIDLPALTDGDRALMRQSAREGLDGQPVGTIRRWENPATGNFGYALLLATFDHTVNGTALKCRRVAQAIKTKQSTEMAIFRLNLCKTPDGEWKLLN